MNPTQNRLILLLSAALGEWGPNALTEAHWHLELKLDYVKWGLAGYPHTPGWGEDLLEARRQLPAGMEMVAVAYADWERAKSIPPAEVAKFAKRFRFRAVLIDTCVKDSKTLLDFIKPAELGDLVDGLRRVYAKVAMARSPVPASARPSHPAQARSLPGGKNQAKVRPPMAATAATTQLSHNTRRFGRNQHSRMDLSYQNRSPLRRRIARARAASGGATPNSAAMRAASSSAGTSCRRTSLNFRD